VRQLAAALQVSLKARLPAQPEGGSKLPHSKGFATDKNYAV
jgi:hypothetical protein